MTSIILILQLINSAVFFVGIILLAISYRIYVKNTNSFIVEGILVKKSYNFTGDNYNTILYFDLFNDTCSVFRTLSTIYGVFSYYSKYKLNNSYQLQTYDYKVCYLPPFNTDDAVYNNGNADLIFKFSMIAFGYSATAMCILYFITFYRNNNEEQVENDQDTVITDLSEHTAVTV